MNDGGGWMDRGMRYEIALDWIREVMEWDDQEMLRQALPGSLRADGELILEADARDPLRPRRKRLFDENREFNEEGA